MKKNYIRPESRLFAINLNENIAQSRDDQFYFNLGYTLNPDGLSGYFATDSDRYAFELTEYSAAGLQAALDSLLKLGIYDVMSCMVW